MASSHDTVVEALRTTLAAIVGGTGGYIYTPDMVRRTMFWPDESALDPSFDTIYLIRPVAKRTAFYDGHRLDRRLEVRVLCCHKFEEPTDNPLLSADPVREQIATDMEADVVEKIWADVRLGQPGIVVDAMSEAWQTDFDWAAALWVVIEIRLVIRYQHPQDGR